MSDVTFVLLLKLSEDGRDHLDEAISTLGDLSRIAGDLDGAIDKWTLTHGAYDAVVMGHCPDLESISSLVGWVVGKRYFVSHTLIGANPAAFARQGMGWSQS